VFCVFFFFSSRRRHTRSYGDWSSDVCSSDLQGHFPGTPLMPGVLMLETLTQVAAVLLLEREGPMPMSRIFLHGVNAAKFRKQVVPGDRLRLEVTLVKARTSLAKAHGVAYVGDQVVAEAELLLALR